MDRKLGGFAAAIILFSGEVSAQEVLSDIASGELCVRYAISLIGGPIGQQIPQTEVANELISRNEKCAPSDIYMEAARYRMLNAQQSLERLQAEAAEEARNQQELEAYERAERSRNIQSALRALQPAPVTRTTCREFAGTVTCDTR